LDGWTNPNGVSIYNFVLLTPENQQFLYHLQDCSGEHHTSEYLALQISEVVERVGKDKIAAVVTDNAPNCANAREIISTKYSKILNIRCIAHFVNLLTKDIM
ncbi:1232_t:CDS:1, partial [Funneliformis geosporum]